MTARPPAFYARRGSKLSDLRTLLHIPYTVWHLSYVTIGAGLAPELDALRLVGTLAAFTAGLGIGAHALDEVHDRPLGTRLSDRILWALGVGGLVVAAGIAVVGAYVISPWVLAWATVGVALSVGYSLEWSSLIHSDLGFALAWGAFPVLVGYWAQSESLGLAAVIGAAGAAVLSLVQRSLSTSAKGIRRDRASETALSEDEDRLLATWEIPLRLLSVAVPLVALAILAV